MGGFSVLVLLGFLSGLFMLFIAVFFVAVLYLIINYVFEALAVLGMRESRGDRAPALAWIPIYNKYLCIDTERKLNMQITSYQDNMAASSEQVSSNKENVMQAEKAVQIDVYRRQVSI